MSKSMASKNAQKKELQEEICVLTIALEDALLAYAKLHHACTEVLESRDDISRESTVDAVNEIVNLIEDAMNVAGQYHGLAVEGRSKCPLVFCDRCQAFLRLESESAGRCLVCNLELF
jgi:hypothetical protein